MPEAEAPVMNRLLDVEINQLDSKVPEGPLN